MSGQPAPPAEQAAPVDNREVKKVTKQHRFFQGIVVGFEGGSGDDRWNERTTVSQTLPDKIPSDFNEEDYLYEHPIQPKFKKDCIIL
ncbi:hypothetical protein PR001_g11367 [Phytophthora rubi]|uniref:Uncharacterized protein n=1 Tax=Phytophthora rubi TaxID=129364 RepID=A0A6A3MCK0_9STRA|nr:hypothetical protein PR002_g10814 [Phytophthora rubi]KAE9030029.1 hypothetical protein PR001_g11367 [Phytophthora rubi]